MRFFSIVPLLLLTGCGSGAMGQAVFSDGCRAEDTTCERRGFEAPIAVGATVAPEVRVDLKGAGTPSAHFTSVGEDILLADHGVLKGRAPGVTAVLLRTDAGTVLDFFHVWVKAPTHLRLFLTSAAGGKAETIDTPIELLSGESVKLAASLFGDGQALAGEADQEWSVDRPIVAVLREGHGGRRRVIALEPGRTTLRVRSLEQTAFVDIVVHAPAGQVASHSHKETAR